MTAVESATCTFFRREPLSLARTLKDKENRFNFPNARAVSLLRLIRASSFPSFSFPPLSPPFPPPPPNRRTPSLRFICLPLACSLPYPFSQWKLFHFRVVVSAAFPLSSLLPPADVPPRSSTTHCASSQSDVNLRSTPSNLRDERTFFG